MADETIVTEIIVDARAAAAGTAVLEAAMRSAQRTFDTTIDRAAKTEASLRAMGEAGEKSGNRLAESARSLAAASRATDTYLGRLDPLIFAQNALGAELGKLQTAFKGLDRQIIDGTIKTQDDAARKAQLLTERMKELDGAIVKLGEGTITAAEGLEVLNTEWERSARASKTAADGLSLYMARAADVEAANRKMILSQQAYNQISSTGQYGVARAPSQPISNPLYGDERLKREADLAAALGDEYEATRAKLIPLDTALEKHRQTILAINDAQSKGILTDLETIQAKVRAGQIYDAHTAAVKKNTDQVKEGAYTAGQMKFAVQQLGVQMSQMVSGIASGQPVLTTFIQQGHQIGDVMLSSGTGMAVFRVAAVALFSALANPLGAFVIVTAGLAAIAAAADSADSRLGALRNRLSLVRDDFTTLAPAAEEAAKKLAATSIATLGEARTGINTQLQSPDVFKGTAEQAAANTLVFVRLSAALGEAETDFNRLTQAMKDPAALMQTMLDQYHLTGLTQGFVDNLRRLQASSEGYMAGAKAIDFLAAATKAATDRTTPLRESIEKLKESLLGGKEAGQKGLLDAVGPPVVGLFTDFFNDLNKGFNDSIEQVKTMIGWWEKFIAVIKETRDALTPSMFTATGANPSQIPLSGPTAAAFAAQAGSSLSDADRAALLVNRTPNEQGVISNATGIFQIIPSTAAGLNKDAANAVQNIQGGIQLIQQLNQQFEGNLTRIISSYSGNRMGSAGLAGYVQKFTEADTSKLDRMFVQVGTEKMTTAQAIQHAGAIANAPPELIEWAMRFATVESGGRQFNTATGLPPSATNLTPVNAAGQILNRNYDVPLPPQQFGPFPLYGPPTSGDRGLGRDLQKDIDDAKKLAEANGVSGKAFETAQDKIKAYQKGLEALDLTHSKDIALRAKMQEGLQAANADLTAAVEPVRNVIRLLDIQIDAQNRQRDATLQSNKAGEEAKARTLAEADARRIGGDALLANATAVQALTDKYLQEAVAVEELASSQRHQDTAREIQLLNAQSNSLTDNYEVRQRNIAILKEQQAIEKTGLNLSADVVAMRLRDAAALADANTQLQIYTQALQEVGNLATQAFDQVGQAITQAFVGGQGAAVNFGNVARAVATSVVQEFIKLAVLNPFLNATVGGANRTTLDQVIGALLGGGGSSAVSGAQAAGSGASGGASGVSGTALSGASSIASLLGLKEGIGGSINAALGGPGGSLFAIQSGGTIWGTPLSGAGSLFGSGPLTAAGPGVATLGGTLAGVGGGLVGGFAAGSLAGGAIQGMRGTTGPAPMIGAGLGAALGTAGGFLIGGPIGALIGGIGGGLLGGGAGGFIGPKKASPFSSTLLSLVDGHAQVGQTYGQGVDTQAEHAQALTDVQQLNDYIDAVSLKLTSLGKVGQLGQNTPGGYPDPSKVTDLNAGFSQLRFSASDPVLNQYLQGRGFADSDALKAAIQGYSTLVSTTIPTLLAQGKATGTVNDAIKELNDTFNAAIAKANEYGVATQDLTAAQAAGEAKIRDAANKQIGDFDAQLRLRGRVASGGDQQSIELDSFDIGAQQQRDQFKAQMVGLFGDAFTTTQYYADQMVLLEQTLGQERLAIVQKYANARAEADRQLYAADQNLQVRFTNASPGDAMAKELFAFDVAADQQRKAWNDQLVGWYGDAFRSSAAYADQMADLERALGAERLQIQQKYADQALQQTQAQQQAAQKSATDAISNLLNYANGLSTSASSPLSPQDQLTLARNRFNAVAGAAGAGDYNSITQLQGFAQTFLDASRVVYGSGTDYVSDFQRVLEALNAVAAVPSDTLTASVMATEIRTQTAELVEVLGELKAAVETVTTQLRQNGTAPGRIAA